jgi:hypothetical protein
MSVARSLANSDASTPEPRSAVLGRSLRFIGILGLVRLGGHVSIIVGIAARGR